MEHTPQHIAIIMDANRRWATQKGLPQFMGHSEGTKTVKNLTELVGKKGIPYLTLYALSTENVKHRTQTELSHLYSLLEDLTKELPNFLSNDICCKVIGDLSVLPTKTQNTLMGIVEKTAHCKKLILTLAINYGGRDEIVRAIKQIINTNTPVTEITEAYVSQHLDTGVSPDVDLVIRTGGDQRLSNFLPWQTVYAELYFTPVYWPDFDETELNRALDWFTEQKRNKGK